ncbi:3-hydroxyacyl-CoA dehydrogenase [Pacificimonas flava]|uniref:3-hydroxyacyl-CoA dehydrogenase n=2 Tax=Pacificimonas TaxID=1960290 RepID=A0A219B815_9SPHN|nr:MULTISPECIES: 3-hydroxyacyl-CoA dehydrogenase NAD-binding domain-containing protein [Pacificimonas]MBZ6379978.1 enoyl-CoA hydratase/isomerase family protein [Pacificimonas aurantium]OWV34497.1 3-hydroxyacyl-CoA dehydrogenase [Pacificimonas flava]
MNTDTIKYDLDGDGIAMLTIDLPNQSMNVINAELQRDMTALIEKISTDDQIKGAVITSGKASGFMAGADLKGMNFGDADGAAKDSGKSKMGVLFDGVFALNKMLRDLETCGKPVAAAVNGLALGGGLEVVLACHYRVCADNPKIGLGLPEVMVGLMPGAGGTQRLPRLMGVQPALMYLVQGNNMKPQEALGFGVIQELAPADEIVDRAKAWVKANPNGGVQPWDQKKFKFPGGPATPLNPGFGQTFVGGTAMAISKTHGNINGPHAILSAVYEGAQVPMDTAIRIESKYFAKLVADPQAGNMIRSLFVSKQAAEKGARRPEGIEPMPTKKIGMLGAGMMGAGIALVSARAGIEVVLLDTSQESAEKGKAYTEQKLGKRMDKEKLRPILDRITPTTDYADLEGCDFIIEAVFEDRDIKAEVTKKTEAVVGADTIFGSNTSTLPITGLAKAWSKPEKFIGVHFFSPVEKMPLVEIIVGEKTGPEAIAKALDYVQQIKKTPIVVNDSRGFYTSRCFGTYVQEGTAMLGEGITPALIENGGKHMGMPVGPLAVSDEVSIELGYKVMQQTKKDMGDAYKEGPSDTVVEKMMAEGRVGRKGGKGYYDYGDAGKQLWPGLEEAFGAHDRPEQPQVEAVQERLKYRQLVECARCYEEGVLETPQDGDLGAIFGWGFMPYTGGPFSHMDTLGIDHVVRVLDRLAQEHGERFSPPKLLRDMAEKGESFYSRPEAQQAA